MHAKIAIQDACILIDLINMELLDNCLQLPFHFCTTEIIIEELYDWQQEKIQTFIKAGTFSIIPISENDMGEISALVGKHPKLSAEDLSAYHYALHNKVLLLTGDKLLKNLALSAKIETSGILFVFDQLVEHGIIIPTDAANILKDLCAKNKRLPKVECDHRIKNWS